jgi:hypothetical protein
MAYFDDLNRSFPKQSFDRTMDFVCRLSSDEYAMVEMQVILSSDWYVRALAYMCAFFGNQLRRGEEWKDIKCVVGINILGGGKGKLGDWVETPAEYQQHYKTSQYVFYMESN